MEAARFEWDEVKNHLNIFTHKVSFQEAVSVFDDDYAIVLPDEFHSEEEERFIIIGQDRIFRELTVVHCYRKNNTVIRLISARKATAGEIKLYRKGRRL